MPTREDRREVAIKRRLIRAEKAERELAKLTPAQRQRKVRRYKKGNLHVVSYVGNIVYNPSKPPKTDDFESNDNKVIFFVFVGEWGYEILSSHGWLRKLKHTYPDLTIGVASRAGVEFLYENAHDVYVDITDVLSKYRSHMFGVPLKPRDQQIVENRCKEVLPDRNITFVYSNKMWRKCGILYGYLKGRSTRGVRGASTLVQERWMQLTLKGLINEKAEIEEAFPGLLNSEYIIVQDRFRPRGWGKESFSAETWKKVLNYLIKLGYHPVLIGYPPWKKYDSESIFFQKEFRNLPHTTNVSDFLTQHVGRNLAYQALLFKNAQFWLGILGSASMLAPLLGGMSYVLSAQRTSVARQEIDLRGWKDVFNKCGGDIEYLDTTRKTDSVMMQLKKHLPARRTFCRQIVKPVDKIAVVSLCWNRLLYTQHCLGTLFEKAGMEFDHFIIDNGSTDGTRKWIEANKDRFKGIVLNDKNLGIGNAKIQTLRLLEKGGYEWFIATPNDVEVLTDDIIKKMNDFWLATKGQFLFSPRLYGIKHVIKPIKNLIIEGFQAEEVNVTGGVYLACSTALFKDYITSVETWRANALCKFAKTKGVKSVYLPELKVNHFETTEGQFRRYPDMKKDYCRDIDLELLPKQDTNHRPFMTFVTRCYKRPKALERCKQSVAAQLDKDFEHIFIIDNVGKGLHWANQQFYEHRDSVRGKYVYIVDDDTYLVDDDLVGFVKRLDEICSPDVIMFKIHIRQKLYPLNSVWKKQPIRGKIAGGCICVKNEVYQKHIEVFGQPKAGDYFFIKDIFDHGNYKIHWEDRIIKQASISRGRREAA